MKRSTKFLHPNVINIHRVQAAWLRGIHTVDGAHYWTGNDFQHSSIIYNVYCYLKWYVYVNMTLSSQCVSSRLNSMHRIRESSTGFPSNRGSSSRSVSWSTGASMEQPHHTYRRCSQLRTSLADDPSDLPRMGTSLFHVPELTDSAPECSLFRVPLSGTRWRMNSKIPV